MPTDGLNLTDEQTNITAVTSRRGSKVNECIFFFGLKHKQFLLQMLGATNIGSKLNLAGNILATPVTEQTEQVSKDFDYF